MKTLATAKRLGVTFLTMMGSAASFAQDTAVNTAIPYDPHLHKALPDKVLEIGLPLLFLYLLLNTVAAVLRSRSDARLKATMIERGVSEETLVRIFSKSDVLLKLQPLKFFLYSLALGVSFVYLHFSTPFIGNGGGYFGLGIILLFTSLAAYIYYRILQRKL